MKKSVQVTFDYDPFQYQSMYGATFARCNYKNDIFQIVNLPQELVDVASRRANEATEIIRHHSGMI